MKSTTPIDSLKHKAAHQQKHNQRSPAVQEFLDNLPVQRTESDNPLFDEITTDVTDSESQTGENIFLRAAVTGLTWGVFATVLAAAAWLMYLTGTEIVEVMAIR